jgi:membrane-bound metal-dependent hydrolase YbcI (DUF457 family)
MLHIFGDLMTAAPVRGALYPISDKLFWILPRFMRFNVGSPFEYVYCVLFAIVLGAFGMMVIGEQIKLLAKLICSEAFGLLVGRELIEAV